MFARLPYEKKRRYLYIAEKASFPKPAPRCVVVWNKQCSGCALEIDTDLSPYGVAKRIAAGGITVRVAINHDPLGYLEAQIAIQNLTASPLQILREAFQVLEIRPKRQTLLFEYPGSVADYCLRSIGQSPAPNPGSTLSGMSTVTSPNDSSATSTTRTTAILTPPARDPAWSSGAYDSAVWLARNIREAALNTVELKPGERAKGKVWFQDDRKAVEVVVRIPLGEFAFDVPFSIPKH